MKFLLWFFDHLPFLACLAVGVTLGIHDHPELAIGLFILGSLSEITGAISKLQADVKALREDKP